MKSILKDSKLIRRRADHLYYNDQTEEVEIFKHKVQEYYSLRCVPQVLGPVMDTIMYASHVLMNEVNSASDNPIIDDENHNVYHGGNFHGDYVALEMDKAQDRHHQTLDAGRTPDQLPDERQTEREAAALRESRANSG